MVLEDDPNKDGASKNDPNIVEVLFGCEDGTTYLVEDTDRQGNPPSKVKRTQWVHTSIHYNMNKSI